MRTSIVLTASELGCSSKRTSEMDQIDSSSSFSMHVVVDLEVCATSEALLEVFQLEHLALAGTKQSESTRSAFILELSRVDLKSSPSWLLRVRSPAAPEISHAASHLTMPT